MSQVKMTFREGKSLYNLWFSLLLIDSNNLDVINSLRAESVSKRACCSASRYDVNGKMIRIARFCSCSSSADR